MSEVVCALRRAGSGAEVGVERHAGEDLHGYVGIIGTIAVKRGIDSSIAKILRTCIAIDRHDGVVDVAVRASDNDGEVRAHLAIVVGAR